MMVSRPTLSQIGEDTVRAYLDAIARTEDIKPVTLRNYESDLRHFGAWLEGSWCEDGREAAFRAEIVSTPAITQYRAHMQTAAKLKPATVNRRLVAVKRFFRWAVQEGRVARNPAAPVKLVEMEAKPPRHLTDREEAALMAAVEREGNARDRALLTTMLHTGVRAQEACDLSPGDVRLAKKDGWLTVRSGKRSKWREIPLNATARDALAAYKAELPADVPYLFPNARGGRLTERGLRLIVAKYARLADVEDVSPHDLRHRFGYRMAAAGTPLQVLAQLMGHDSLDTTMVYIRATRGDLQSAVEKIAWR